MRIALLTVVIGLLMLARTPAAHACDPSEFLTPFDLYDRAATVVVAKVDKISKRQGTTTLTVVETLRGSPGSTLTVNDSGRSTCSPGWKVGRRGVLFLDADGNLVGLYDAFQTEGVTTWTDALKRYGAATTDADRAAPMVDLAVSKDWTRSFDAAYTLAARDALVQALDQTARDRLKARARKVSSEHPLRGLARRL